jgi:hypothetical protein
MRVRLFTLCLALLTTTLWPPAPAEATSAGTSNVEFQVNGSLYPFPSTNGTTTFNGQGTGAGRATGMSGGVVHDATFTILAMPVSGSANYSGPAWPVCPLIGSATPDTGSISMGAANLTSVTGVVYRQGATHSGTVTGVTTSFNFSYQRVGANATLVLTDGLARVYFYYPGFGSGSFEMPFSGAGTGVFQVDPVQAEVNCRNGGGPAIPFTFTGDAVVVGDEAVNG